MLDVDEDCRVDWDDISNKNVVINSEDEDIR